MMTPAPAAEDPPLPLGRRVASPALPSSTSTGITTTSSSSSGALPLPSSAPAVTTGDVHVVRAETAALDTALREVETLRAHDYQLLKTALHEELAALKGVEARVRAQADAWAEQQRYKTSDAFKERVKADLRAAPLMVHARRTGQQQQTQRREHALLVKLDARLVEAREDKHLLADELARLRLELSRTRLDTEQASKLLADIRADLQLAGALPSPPV